MGLSIINLKKNKSGETRKDKKTLEANIFRKCVYMCIIDRLVS